MTIKGVERNHEPCAESGWVGYYIHLAQPVSYELVMALAPLGQLSYLKTLKRPFFSVRGRGFLLRGIQGDSFLKAGFATREMTGLESIRAAIQGVPGVEE